MIDAPREIPELEIACHDHDRALRITKELLEEDYVVMLSQEEGLWIINAVWSENCGNRNDVVFMGRYEYDSFLENLTSTTSNTEDDTAISGQLSFF